MAAPEDGGCQYEGFHYEITLLLKRNYHINANMHLLSKKAICNPLEHSIYFIS